MSKIFISYRRQDSSGYVIGIYDRLKNEFNEEDIFRDLDTIEFGVDFVEVLENAVQQCDILLAIIGPHWLTISDANGRKRLDNPNDFVRLEIATALERKIRVIPVLVGGATMPYADELPDNLKSLARRNALPIDDRDFHAHLDRLIRALHRALKTKPKVQVESKPKPIATTPTLPTSLKLMPKPFDWIEIPGGHGTLKTNQDDVTLAIPTESYWIAKYPVTNAQFKVFIDAGGYSSDKWWTKEGWQKCQEGWHYDSGWKASGTPWAEPRYWGDSKWNGTEQPVVGVSWFEAVAFCLWLSDATGEKIMLPTEAQWQYAAQGNDGRTYPWGNTWNRDLCNNNVDKKGIGKTSSVRQYEGKGDSPFKVVDMVGNVWEWCLTDYENNTNKFNSNATQRVLRGGSWLNFDAEDFRCEFRFRNLPYDGYFSVGFRCARSY